MRQMFARRVAFLVMSVLPVLALLGMLGTEPSFAYDVSEAANTTRFAKNPHARMAKMTAPLPTRLYVHDPEECQFISRSLLRYGVWEPEKVHILLNAMSQSEVPPGKTPYFFDIGANIGVYTMQMAAGGHRVLAFEPMQYNTELLAASIAEVGVDGMVRLAKTALSHSSSADLCIAPASLGSPEINRGNGQLVPIDPETGSCGPGQETVPVRSIDDVLAELSLSDICVNAVKADVEGFENFALRGGASVMQGPCPPCVVQIEFIRPYAKAAERLQYGQHAGEVGGHAIFEFLVQELNFTCVRHGFLLRQEPVHEPFAQVEDGDYVCILRQHPRCRDVLVPPF